MWEETSGPLRGYRGVSLLVITSASRAFSRVGRDRGRDRSHDTGKHGPDESRGEVGVGVVISENTESRPFLKV